VNFSDYIVYVDESGDHGLKNINPEFPVFALVFVIIKKSDYSNKIISTITDFKNKYWGHDQIILHENDIRREKGNFSFLRADKKIREEFYNDLVDIIKNAPFQYISCIIDKEKLKEKHRDGCYNPYEISMLFCMERLLTFLTCNNQIGKTMHIVIEERGAKEDKKLEVEFRKICSNDRNWGYKNNDFSTMQFDLIHSNKKSNSSGLQLADLIARPIALQVLRSSQPNRAFDVFNFKGSIKCFP